MNLLAFIGWLTIGTGTLPTPADSLYKILAKGLRGEDLDKTLATSLQ
jgi:hypothetical protein